MTESLNIPYAATHWLAEAFMACPLNEPQEGPEYRYWGTKIAAPVVAAELRRLAALLDESNDAAKLIRRAGELDGGHQ